MSRMEAAREIRTLAPADWDAAGRIGTGPPLGPGALGAFSDRSEPEKALQVFGRPRFRTGEQRPSPNETMSQRDLVAVRRKALRQTNDDGLHETAVRIQAHGTRDTGCAAPLPPQLMPAGFPGAAEG